MASFHIDKSKCVKCRACILDCPRLIITADSDGYPMVKDEDEYYCMQCGHCIISCRYGASSLGNFNHGQAVDLGSTRFPSPDESRRLLCTRRSVRKFTGKPVNRETLIQILDVARYAPSASNRQQVRWIVLENERLDTLKKHIMAEVSKDPSEKAEQRYSRQEDQQKQGKDPVFRGAPMLVAAVMPGDSEWKEDAVIALSYLEIAAHSLGVGSMWSAFMIRELRRSNETRAFLDLNETEWVGGVLLLGYNALQTSTLLPNKKQTDLTILD